MASSDLISPDSVIAYDVYPADNQRTNDALA